MSTDKDNSAPELPVVPKHVTKEIFVSAGKNMITLLLSLLIFGGIVSYLFWQMPGIWGVLLGVAVTILFSGTTIFSMWISADKSPNVTMAIVLGTWVVKMLVIIVLFLFIRDLDFYNKTALVAVILLGTVGTTLLDAKAVFNGRAPYVVPSK